MSEPNMNDIKKGFKVVMIEDFTTSIRFTLRRATPILEGMGDIEIFLPIGFVWITMDSENPFVKVTDIKVGDRLPLPIG